jgi:hypothetical protein
MIKIKNLLESRILVTRHTPEERIKSRLLSAKKSIEQCTIRPCRGDLDLSNVEIRELPDNFTVQGDLNLMNTKITTLPDNLTVGGSLILYGLRNLKTLPGTVEVKESLNMNTTGIGLVEKGIQLTGNLSARDTYLTTLPENTEIGGNLDLTGAKIETLPKDLKVGGNIYLRNTPLSRKVTAEWVKQQIPGILGSVDL